MPRIRNVIEKEIKMISKETDLLRNKINNIINTTKKVIPKFRFEGIYSNYTVILFRDI